jgi:hypothetical protein
VKIIINNYILYCLSILILRDQSNVLVTNLIISFTICLYIDVILILYDAVRTVSEKCQYIRTLTVSPFL